MRKYLLTILLSTIIAGQASDINKHQTIDKAIEYYKVGEYKKSKEIFIEFLYSDKGSKYEPEIRYHLGVISFLMSNIDRGFYQFKKMTDSYPNHVYSKKVADFIENIVTELDSNIFSFESDYIFEKDLEMASLLWTPEYINQKLYFSNLKDPKEAVEFYEALYEKYDSKSKRITILYNLFKLECGLNSNDYGINNFPIKSTGVKRGKAKKFMNSKHIEKMDNILERMNENITDSGDPNVGLLIQANYLAGLRRSGSEFFSGNVIINEESKPYFQMVLSLTEEKPYNIYRVFSEHWLND